MKSQKPPDIHFVRARWEGKIMEQEFTDCHEQNLSLPSIVAAEPLRHSGQSKNPSLETWTLPHTGQTLRNISNLR